MFELMQSNNVSLIVNDETSGIIVDNGTIRNNNNDDDCWSEDVTSIIYQLAYVCFLFAYLIPTGKYCLLFIHLILLLANTLSIVWICKICMIESTTTTMMMMIPSSFLGWSITLLIVNMLRIANELYLTRHIKFDKELESTYNELFEIYGISRESFRKLIKHAKLMTLNSGESYATEKITVNNRLSLLISGKINVLSNNHFLHSIEPGEFLDSPEWDSCHRISTKSTKQESMKSSSLETSLPLLDTHNSNDLNFDKNILIQQLPPPPHATTTSIDNRFNVTLIAIQQCRLLCWNIIDIQLYLTKDKQMAKIFNLLIGRDIINKLYSMNANIISDKASILDIRLPILITSMTKQLNQQQQQLNRNQFS